MIELRLLGPAAATVDGEAPPKELMWRKHLSLLAYLAVAPDRRAGRSSLAGLLWGDKPEEAARQSLAEALRIIRRATGGGLQDAGAGYIQLDGDAVETDTDRFLALLEADDPAGAAALVAGEFMEGLAIPDAWEFEEWLASQRRTWRTRSERALVEAARSALAGGMPDRALELAGRALALVPTSEAACRVEMRCRCLLGDRGGALARFERFGEGLREELGIEPTEETVALAERVRRQRSWHLPAERTARDDRGAESRRGPLVGRTEELRKLVDAWEACRRTGSARVAVIAGHPGTGRSRLLEELLARARLDGAATVLVRALPADRDTEGEVLETVASTLGIDPTARGLDLIDEIRRLGGEAPLVVAVDDAGWTDDTSLEELVRVAARASDVPVLLVFVTGPRSGRAAVDRLASMVERDVPGALVHVDRLELEALRELTAWAMPDYDDHEVERLARRVAADTAGHPLLAVELLHGVAHGLALEPGMGAWPATGRTLDQTRPGELPGTLVAAVRVGFRILTSDAQRALAAAAVLEPPVPAARIGAATDLEGQGLAEALDELEWEHWLVADARGYGFVAPLVREVVARDMVTEGQRRRILESG